MHRKEKDSKTKVQDQKIKKETTDDQTDNFVWSTLQEIHLLLKPNKGSIQHSIEKKEKSPRNKL